jgi:hypothetical protein
VANISKLLRPIIYSLAVSSHLPGPHIQVSCLRVRQGACPIEQNNMELHLRRTFYGRILRMLLKIISTGRPLQPNVMLANLP